MDVHEIMSKTIKEVRSDVPKNQTFSSTGDLTFHRHDTIHFRDILFLDLIPIEGKVLT